MTARLFALLNISFSCSIRVKRGFTLILIAASFNAHSAPVEMGSMTVTSSNASTGAASGTYIASGSGATGSFTLVRNENIGYNSNAEITPASGTRANGIEIRNDSNTSIDRDKFKYTFTITPNDSASIHTIKIGQASYSMGGNSEIARQTLSFTQNSKINIPVQATVKNNLNVPYFYNAMGDYFMGTRLNATQLNSQNAVSNPQLRTDSSTVHSSGLYYYNITSLAGATGSQNPYTPTLTNNQVTLNSNNGVLPPTPTFENIIKNISNSSTYSALSPNTGISNGGTYVSYGIENSQSNYVVAVRNANAVTLTYEGIMNGNIGISRAVIGETFNEWISFGVESETLNYVFSGTVFNDNGGINDSDINVKKDNATIDSGIYNNANFFNGSFDSAESGIAGSTVKLVDDCISANPTVYATKILTAVDIGSYQFTIPASIIGNKNTVCVIETRTDTDYPIRTTANNKTVNLVANNYSYSNNNFGRVIDKNVALVLEKEQALNDCKIDSLLPTLENKLAYSKTALSEVTPGHCIAYKITATNRTNLSINNFVLQDILQEKNVNGAIVTSKLANPIHQASEYTADSVAIGNNGTVKTVTSILNPRTKRSFYFNTKYGTTQSN